MREGNRKTRRIAASMSVFVAVILFAALGGAGLAQTAIALVQYQYGHGAQYQYGKKITICHKGKNTISISVNAWPAHLRHGDAEGRCAVVRANGVVEAQQSAESIEGPATGKTKKPKGGKKVHGANSAAKGKPEKSKPGKGKPGKGAQNGPPSVESSTPGQGAVAPAASKKPKKEKGNPNKGGQASPPGLGNASPPGHGNGHGNGNGGGNGNGKGNGKNK